MNQTITDYHNKLSEKDKAICNLLGREIDRELKGAESKVWHAHPVWFLAGNPIVGYSKLKDGVRLMFWSGADFQELGLAPGTGKFKDASITYQAVDQINIDDLKRWLEKSKVIQWDYKNIVKNKGRLEKLTPSYFF